MCHMRNNIVVVVAAAAALLAGCADGGSSPAGDAPAANAPALPTTTAAPSPSDADTERAEPSDDARLTVTGIRIGHHDGFDRVVYDLGGTGTPGWIVEYTDVAYQDGSGAPIEVAGQSILEVRITGSAYPFDSGVEEYAGPDPVVNPSAPGIAGVYRSLVFEGVTQSFIGVNADHPAFSVSTQSDPTRLVIDIATE
ncbi:hypothetical protein B0T44_09110 [Nocardia donostiensis]|uniref:AMIN-like domain-containing protein n=2 Tax=Nocardia donostiensis TaxID=1538463 RepID=A0A1W0B4M1_9NOCA|nr:hypothetical protein B0T46_01355 [Nocardia donostiensis]OQS17434.1 hypothetical protein B0T36_00815 [Nocardia donostiensis]OQS20837.1 hypothetical protein B0T44_09110 [Nocardia donostiensis]